MILKISSKSSSVPFRIIRSSVSKPIVLFQPATGFSNAQDQPTPERHLKYTGERRCLRWSSVLLGCLWAKRSSLICCPCPPADLLRYPSNVPDYFWQYDDRGDHTNYNHYDYQYRVECC